MKPNQPGNGFQSLGPSRGSAFSHEYKSNPQNQENLQSRQQNFNNRGGINTMNGNPLYYNGMQNPIMSDFQDKPNTLGNFQSQADIPGRGENVVPQQPPSSMLQECIDMGAQQYPQLTQSQFPLKNEDIALQQQMGDLNQINQINAINSMAPLNQLNNMQFNQLNPINRNAQLNGMNLMNGMSTMNGMNSMNGMNTMNGIGNNLGYMGIPDESYQYFQNLYDAGYYPLQQHSSQFMLPNNPSLLNPQNSTSSPKPQVLTLPQTQPQTLNQSNTPIENTDPLKEENRNHVLTENEEQQQIKKIIDQNMGNLPFPFQLQYNQNLLQQPNVFK